MIWFVSMARTAKLVSLCSDIVDLKYVLIRFKADKDLSHWAVLTEIVRAIFKIFSSVGKAALSGVSCTVPARGNVKMKRVRTHLVANSNAFAFTTPK